MMPGQGGGSAFGAGGSLTVAGLHSFGTNRSFTVAVEGS